LIVAIPLFVEFGLPEFQKKDLNMIYIVLHMTDFFLCFNSLVIYTMISKLVTGISYLPDEHKILIKQFSGRFMNERILKFDPKELIKCKKQVLNPFVGYRSTVDSN